MGFSGVMARRWSGRDVPIERTPSGAAWQCASGKHRHHRAEGLAKRCKWRSMPPVPWVPPALDFFDLDLGDLTDE